MVQGFPGLFLETGGWKSGKGEPPLVFSPVKGAKGGGAATTVRVRREDALIDVPELCFIETIKHFLRRLTKMIIKIQKKKKTNYL